MYLGKADVNTYDKGVEREFLVSNGTGNYGFSTVVGANTRSEHGLLVVRPQDAKNHTVLVSKLEETLYAHNKKYQLSTNRYKDLIYPDGYRYLQEYQGTPFPSMLFVIHSIFLKKSIFMPVGGTCTIIKYELLAAPDSVTMDIRPLCAHRVNSHLHVTGEKSQFESSASTDGVVNVRGRGIVSHISFSKDDNSTKWSSKPLWYENMIYERDGMPDNQVVDYLWSPGYGTVSLSQGEVFYVVLSEEPLHYTLNEIREMEQETVKRQNEFVDRVTIDSSYGGICDMIQSSCHLVADNDGRTHAIFSGFPSVELRARDTFIAFPGLLLATGRLDTAKAILDTWIDGAKSCNDIVPAMEAQGEWKIGDIDSNLWLLYAADKYTTATGTEYAIEKYQDLTAIIDKYLSGDEMLGAVMDSDTKLIKYFNQKCSHWMSGDVRGEQLVKRKGYLVEINALWHNALMFMKKIAETVGDNAAVTKYSDIISPLVASFEKIFWNEETSYLYDWVDPTDGSRDEAIRPNAILAVSLPYPILADDKGRKVFSTCWNELYTTYGLRTLDPHHDKFKGRAEGRPDQKMKARLRGMAWPWLLGHFVTAYMRFNPTSKEMGWTFMRPFSSHLRRGCLGGVSQLFDGMMPYRPNGDVLSAVSLGELLRVMYEDLNGQE